jgi:hypothetical protein
MNAPVRLRPGALWSLWDIMRKAYVAQLLLFAAISGNARTKIAISTLHPVNDKHDQIDRDTLETVIGEFNRLEEHCMELELTCSVATVRSILRKLQASKPPTFIAMAPLYVELQGRLVDEIDQRFFLALDVRESELYNNPTKSWAEIIARFPDTVSDVEEASKCLALSRYAAAVFHSLQIVERGLIELGTEIGVADPLSGWTAVTGRLQAIQKTKFQDRSAFERKHAPFLEQMVATVEGLKNAWRNKVSHAHGKLTLMTADFSPEIAEEILFATRAFMRRLATDGPLAEGGPPP